MSRTFLSPARGSHCAGTPELTKPPPRGMLAGRDVSLSFTLQHFEIFC